MGNSEPQPKPGSTIPKNALCALKFPLGRQEGKTSWEELGVVRKGVGWIWDWLGKDPKDPQIPHPSTSSSIPGCSGRLENPWIHPQSTGNIGIFSMTHAKSSLNPENDPRKSLVGWAGICQPDARFAQQGIVELLRLEKFSESNHSQPRSVSPRATSPWISIPWEWGLHCQTPWSPGAFPTSAIP